MENISARHVAAEVVVDIGKVFASITGMLEDVQEPREEQSTIFKVGDAIRKLHPEAYKPQIVSIGPFHRGDSKLLPVERIKRQFLQKLISRHHSNTLDKYIMAVSTPSFIADVSSCYSEEVVRNDGAKSFVEMLVLDGCFIIELLVRIFTDEPLGELSFTVGNLSRLRIDLLMIENQIPFCVLQVLFDSSSIPSLHSQNDHITFNNEPDSSSIPSLHSQNERITFSDLALSYLTFTKMSIKSERIPEVVYHLLHLHHSSVRHTPPEDMQSRSTTCRITNMMTIKHGFFQIVVWVLSLLRTCRLPLKDLKEDPWGVSRPISNATELYQTGITFQRKRSAKCFLDITFRDSDGVMEIPMLTISPTTVPEFRNLVIFEEHLSTCGRDYSTYMGFMDCLVDTTADVELLERSGVLSTDLGGPEEVALFINNLGNLAYWNLKGTYLAELFERVQKYSSNESNRLRARTMQDYFSTPWSAMSVFAAILLLLLTILQTFYAVFAYYRPP